MGVRVHREWVSRSYVADRLSCAYCFWVASLVVVVLAPFFLAYTSHSLWLRENTYREQPDVRFQYKMLMLAEGTTTSAASPGVGMIVTFTGDAGNLAPMTADVASLQGGAGTIEVVETTAGIAAVAEVQTATCSGTSGTFKLAYGGQTTAALDWDSSAAEVQTAFAGLSSVTSATVTFSTGTAACAASPGVGMIVTFTGDAGNLAPMTADVASLQGGAGTIEVVETTAGIAAVAEVQTATCSGTSGTFKLAYGGQTTAALDWDSSAAEVQTAFAGLSSVTSATVTFSTGTAACAASQAPLVSPLQLFWSTNTSFNNLYHDSVRAPVMRTSTEDYNRDARTDQLKVSAEMPLAVGEAIHSVSILLFFDFRLDQRAKLQMESVGFVSESSPLPGSRVDVDADLVLQQSLPLIVKGGFKTPYKDFPLIPPSSSSARALLLPQLVRAYRDRNETTNLVNKYAVWQRHPAAVVAEDVGARQNFTVSTTVRIPAADVLYVPDWSEVVKVAWIQYFAIFAVIYYLLDLLMSFVFTNQILETTVITSHPSGFAGPKLHKF